MKSLTPADLVKTYHDFVSALAAKTAKSLKMKVEREDLLAYGFRGLLEAQDRFDPSRTTGAFTSFAFYRVRGAILDGCRKEGWIPRERKKAANKARSINEYMESTASARESMPKPATFADAAARVADVVSDVVTISFLEEGELENTESGTLNPLEQLEKKSTRQLLKVAFENLTDEERDIIVRFYFERETMGDIAVTHGKSKSWVSRIHTRAITTMRKQITRNE